MPLRITLKPRERLIINGASIRNGDRSADIVFENHSKFLRGSEIILESEATTPCKKLCLLIQIIHLSESSEETEQLFFQQSVGIMKIMPTAAPFLLEIQQYLTSNETHRAIKAARQLMFHEQEIIDHQLSKFTEAQYV